MTDAYLLMQFGADIAHLKPIAAQPDAAVQAEIKRLGQPAANGLKQNGHASVDIINLLRRVIYA